MVENPIVVDCKSLAYIDNKLLEVFIITIVPHNNNIATVNIYYG